VGVTPEREAARVVFDRIRGHVTLCGATGPALVTMVDTGSRLELWSHEGAHMSPDIARMLATALNAWADKKAAQAVA
jgi:hypothetical protein